MSWFASRRSLVEDIEAYKISVSKLNAIIDKKDKEIDSLKYSKSYLIEQVNNLLKTEKNSEAAIFIKLLKEILGSIKNAS